MSQQIGGRLWLRLLAKFYRIAWFAVWPCDVPIMCKEASPSSRMSACSPFSDHLISVIVSYKNLSMSWQHVTDSWVRVQRLQTSHSRVLYHCSLTLAPRNFPLQAGHGQFFPVQKKKRRMGKISSVTWLPLLPKSLQLSSWNIQKSVDFNYLGQHGSFETAVGSNTLWGDLVYLNKSTTLQICQEQNTAERWNTEWGIAMPISPSLLNLQHVSKPEQRNGVCGFKPPPHMRPFQIANGIKSWNTHTSNKALCFMASRES